MITTGVPARPDDSIAAPLSFATGAPGARVIEFTGRQGLELIRSMYTVVSPNPDGFHATIATIHPNRLVLNYFRITESTAIRDEERLRLNPRRTLSLDLCVAGGLEVSQRGRTAVLGPGNASFKLGTEQAVLEIRQPSTLIQVLSPLDAFHTTPADLDAIIARPLPPGPLVSAALRFITATAEGLADTDKAAGRLIEQTVLDTIIALVTSLTDPDAHRWNGPMRTRIREHIHSHLADPELSPSTVAAHFAMSRPALYRLFEDTSINLAAYIRDLRLRHVAKALGGTNPPLVADLAAQWGFHSADHMARAFRARYGQSPTRFQARQRHPQVLTPVG